MLKTVIYREEICKRKSFGREDSAVQDDLVADVEIQPRRDGRDPVFDAHDRHGDFVFRERLYPKIGDDRIVIRKLETHLI